MILFPALFPGREKLKASTNETTCVLHSSRIHIVVSYVSKKSTEREGQSERERESVREREREREKEREVVFCKGV